MKKLLSSILIACMVLGLTACGGKEQSATYRAVMEQDGMIMTDTMTLQAKGDKVQKLDEVIEMDLSAFTADEYKAFKSAFDIMVEQYQAIDGAECIASENGQIYTMTISVDATGDAISKLAEAELMEVEGDANGISLKKTGEALVASGYEKVE